VSERLENNNMKRGCFSLVLTTSFLNYVPKS